MASGPSPATPMAIPWFPLGCEASDTIPSAVLGNAKTPGAGLSVRVSTDITWGFSVQPPRLPPAAGTSLFPGHRHPRKVLVGEAGRLPTGECSCHRDCSPQNAGSHSGFGGKGPWFLGPVPLITLVTLGKPLSMETITLPWRWDEDEVSRGTRCARHRA